MYLHVVRIYLIEVRIAMCNSVFLSIQVEIVCFRVHVRDVLPAPQKLKVRSHVGRLLLDVRPHAYALSILHIR